MKRALLFAIGMVWSLVLHAVEFTVSDIRVEGLQRVSAGTVFAALPVGVGDRVDDTALRDATRSLFQTGYFDDIAISRDERVLVITLLERPSVSDINIEGNKAIETEALMEGLKQSGLAEGQVFRRAILEGMQLELQRQYIAQGRYGASVETSITELPRNRVVLDININEGDVAKIKHVNIVGNEVFGDEELTDLFELKTSGMFSWFSNSDRYAKEKLSGDIERLTSYYMDRGYLQFNVDSTQVSISPDKKTVYITVNVIEGDLYKVSKVNLAGDLIVEEEVLRRLILVREENTFSQVLMTTTSDYLTQRLGNEGYTFARVRGIPELNMEDKTVEVTFFVEPGNRSYVRRINFRGNIKTADEVLRREMRQLEASSASTAKIEQSKVRLQRLGFFKEVQVDTPPVPGSEDLLDVNFTVEEQPSGSIGASVGFAQGTGVVLGANIQQNNFLGSGKKVGFGVNSSSYRTSYNFNYLDPYYTPDGVSRGFSLFYQKTDFDELNISNYSTDAYGAEVEFGYPIKETERVGFSLGYTNTKIEVGSSAVKEIQGSPGIEEFIDGYAYLSEYLKEINPDESPENFNFGASGDSVPVLSQYTLDVFGFDTLNDSQFADSPDGFIDVHGDEFDNFTLTGSWRQSTLNRGRLANRGASQSVSLEVTVPGSDLEFYKLRYLGQIYAPLSKHFTLRFKTELGYGDGFGSTEGLPFFENFFSGGFGSVRGYRRSTLGPRSTPADFYPLACARMQNGGCVSTPDGEDFIYLVDDVSEDGTLLPDNLVSLMVDPNRGDNDTDPFGGNILVEGSMELLFPLPFIKDQRSLQTVFFVDGGNVFSSDCGVTQLACTNVDMGELRYSSGLGLTWITGFGPLTFSLAKALNPGSEDETEVFQFSLGQAF